MSDWTPKVFWTEVTVEATAAGYEIRLDGRPVKTPAKANFVVPRQGLAAAAAAEWRAQEEIVDSRTMPYTRTINSAIDRVSAQRDEVVELLAAYAENDLVCYRAAQPEGLVARQAAAWDPLLTWAEARYGAPLHAVAGVMHQPQPEDSLAVLAQQVGFLDSFELAAFHDLVTLSGSLVIALALADGHARPPAMWEASRVDETWQIEQWGEDEEAAEHAAIKTRAFFQAATFLSLARGETFSG